MEEGEERGGQRGGNEPRGRRSLTGSRGGEEEAAGRGGGERRRGLRTAPRPPSRAGLRALARRSIPAPPGLAAPPSAARTGPQTPLRPARRRRRRHSCARARPAGHYRDAQPGRATPGKGRRAAGARGPGRCAGAAGPSRRPRAPDCPPEPPPRQTLPQSPPRSPPDSSPDPRTLPESLPWTLPESPPGSPQAPPRTFGTPPLPSTLRARRAGGSGGAGRAADRGCERGRRSDQARRAPGHWARAGSGPLGLAGLRGLLFRSGGRGPRAPERRRALRQVGQVRALAVSAAGLSFLQGFRCVILEQPRGVSSFSRGCTCCGRLVSGGELKPLGLCQCTHGTESWVGVLVFAYWI